MDQQLSAKKKVGKPFEKGKSGNPSGRPKVVQEIRTMARNHGAEAFKRVLELMRSEDERVSFSAAQEVLNRGYGKPTQNLDVTVEKRDVADLSDDELVSILTGGGSGASDEEEGETVTH